MFGFFKKNTEKLAISQQALENMLDEMEALLKKGHPDKSCDGPCEHLDPEKDILIFQELMPRAMIVCKVAGGPKAEAMLTKLTAMYIMCFLKKNNIDYIKM